LRGAPKLTVAIVSFNTRALLEACLSALRASLAATPELGARVVVVDNASADGSAAMVRARFPEVELLASPENLGFAGGNNLVLRQAGTPYVLLLNPDTEVRAGAVGGRLVYPDGSFQHAAFRFPTLPMSFFDFFPLNHRLIDSRLNGRYPRSWYGCAFEIDHPLGAALMLRREALDQVGPLDEGYFMYAEEVDLCWRIKRAGWQIWYTPDATIVHHQAAATGQFRGEMLVHLHRSRYRFFARHYPAWFGRAARAVVGVGVLRDLARAATLRRRGGIDAAEWRRRRVLYGRLLAL
jgi:N-acetylglucosaminyl-diphospho-decaprenol L-rhamnosyltransferase